MKNILELLNDFSEDAKFVFNTVQKNGPQTKSDISFSTNMKLTTLNRTMMPLEKMGLVVQSCIGESTGGRKPVLYDINTERYFIVGVDISRTYTQVVITNLKMDVLYKERFIMDSSCSPKKTVKLISKIIKNGVMYLNIDIHMLLGIGVGTVGPLDRKNGILISPLYFNAPGWIKVPIKEMLEKELVLPVIVDNGANVAVLAETLFGIGKGVQNIAYVNCGIGIRTGAISSGKIVRTINDAEDAFGHMIIDVDGKACSCGNFGCIECYSSIHAITKEFVTQLKKEKILMISKPMDQINYIDICEAAEKNNELAKEIITGSGEILGAGLANFINLLNPSLVILSGPLIMNSKLFYQVCIDTASKKSYLSKGNKILFSRGGNFKSDAIAVGSAALVIENYLGSKIL